MQFKMLNRPAESSRLIEQMRQSVREERTLCLCLVFYWFWQFSFFQSPATLLADGGVGDGWSPREWLLVASAVMYLLLWVGHKRVARIARKAFYLPSVAAAMVGGTAMVLFSVIGGAALEGGLSAALCLAGACLMGVGAAPFVAETGRVFAQLGPRYALYAGVVGILGGMLLYALLLCMPSVFMKVCQVVSPALAVGFLMRSLSRRMRMKFYEHGLESSLHVPVRFALTCLVQGLGLGAMTGLLSKTGALAGEPISYIVAFVVGALLIITTALTLKMDFNHLVYRIGFPCMATGFILLVCFPDNFEYGGVLLTIGHCYMYVIITCICAYFSNRLNSSPVWIVSLSTFFLVVGQILGTIVSSHASGSFMQTVESPTIVASFMAFLIPVLALALFDDQNTRLGWGAIKPGERDVGMRDILVEKLSGEYRLTAREIDVAALLARGRNKRYISQKLGLSEETIKSHIGNIYRKLLVHSQQELIDLIEDECSVE